MLPEHRLLATAGSDSGQGEFFRRHLKDNDPLVAKIVRVTDGHLAGEDRAGIDIRVSLPYPDLE